jgi:hypothetical protein
MQLLGYDIRIIDKVWRNTFVITVGVNCLAYDETTTTKYKQTYSATALTTDSQMQRLC